MASKKRPQANAPEGFVQVRTSISGFWKPEGADCTLQGIVGEAVTVKGSDGRPNRFFPLQLTSEVGGPVCTADGKEIPMEVGMIVGVGGKMLAMFLEGHKGREVFLEYTGLGTAKKGQNPPKMFNTYARPESE